MKRYWNFVRMEKMRELLKEGRAEEAMEIADTIDLNSIRSIHDINTVAEVYLSSGKLSRAHEAYMIVWRHNKSRRVIMQLINIALQRKNVKDAEHFANEYARMSEGDFYNEIYRYSIDKLKEKDISVLIRDLEKLKRKEYIDSWAYELAKLYFKNGETKACMEECDNIAVWFGEGEYVDKARALGDYCRKILEEEAAAGENDKPEAAEGGAQEYNTGENEAEEYEVEVTLEELEAFEAAEKDKAEAARRKKEAYLDECIRNVEEAGKSRSSSDTAENADELTGEAEEATAQNDLTDAGDAIEAAAKKPANNGDLLEITGDSEDVDDEQLCEAWREATAEDGEDHENSENTVNASEPEEEPDNTDREIPRYTSRWEEAVTPAEEIPPTPYKELEDEELDRLADDVAVAVDSEEAMVSRMLLEEENLLRDAVNMVVSEEAANRRLAGAAETNGKTAKGATAADTEEAADESAAEEIAEETAEEVAEEVAEAVPAQASEEAVKEVTGEITEEATEEAAEDVTEEASMEAPYVTEEVPKETTETLTDSAAEKAPGEIKITSAPSDFVTEGRKSAAKAVVIGGYLEKLLQSQETGLDSYFGYYAFHDGVRGQLLRALEVMLNPQARSLNLIISGEKESGRQDIAKGIIKLLSKSGLLKSMSIGVLDSEKVNHMDLLSKADKLQGNSLIIRDAGRLTNSAADSVRQLSEKLVGKRTAIILIDNRSGINELFRNSKALNSHFSNRIHLPGLSTGELKNMAYTMIDAAGLQLSEKAGERLAGKIQEIVRLNREGAYGELERLVKRAIESVENRNAREYINAQLEKREAAPAVEIILPEDIM